MHRPIDTPVSVPERQRRRARARVFALVPIVSLAIAMSGLSLAFASSARAQSQVLAAPPAAESRQDSTGASESPREVIRPFVDAARSGGMERAELEVAGEAFDLADVPEGKRRQRGTELAELLTRILTRIGALELAEFPNAAEVVEGQDAWETVLHPQARPEVGVRLAFARPSGGAWKLDRSMGAELERAWVEVRILSPVGPHPRTLPELVREKVPPHLKGGGFLLEHYQWIGLALIVALGVVLDRVARVLLRPLIRRLSRTDGLTIDKALLADFERPIGALVTVLVFVLALPALDLEPRTYRVLDLAASFVLAVAGVWAAYRLVDVLCWVLAQRAARTANTFDDMLVPLLRRTLKVFVVVVGIVFVASRLSDDLWHVLAGLSIGSLAVGFAAKDSIENLFGTFTVLLDKPFKLGDVVKMPDIEGTVEEVGFRSTRVRTPEDSLITVPNSRFIASSVNNLGARRYRRVKTTLGLTYDTPPEKIEAFCEGVRELIRRHPYTRKEEYFVWLAEFSPSSLDVLLQFQLDVPNYGTEVRERHRLFADVLRLARQLNVSFAFPTQTVHQVSLEELDHTDAPKSSADALEVGRKSALAIAERSVAPFDGSPPPPLRFDPQDPDATSSLPKKR